MNTLPPNFNQNHSRLEVYQAFESDPNFSAEAATVFYFKLLEINQKYQLLQGQMAEMEQAKTTTTVDLPPFLQSNQN